MKLIHLLGSEGPDLGPIEVTGITEDSRRAAPGMIFVAARGEHADGHAYAEEAVRKGVVAVLGDQPGLTTLHGVPYLYQAQPREALGRIAHEIAGNPSREMTVIGVTGTNGKSSTVLLVQHFLAAGGISAACLGTLGYQIGGERKQAPHTTPFGEDLAHLFAQAYAANQRHLVMEVSSHALAQHRVAGIEFRVAAFTNLTQDHLDYHTDMDEYRAAKLRLFEKVTGPGAFSVVNADDPSAPAFVEASSAPCFTYGVEGDCRAAKIRHTSRSTAFTLETPWGSAEAEMALLGAHNVANALAATAIAGGLGLSLDTIVQGMGSMPCVPGRFERVDAGQPFQVIVDYAHTEDGLRNVLKAARAICRGRIIVVFGCGGDRDKGKRPKMAGVAAELADFSVITSDNPRTESPERIVLDIEVGMQRAGKRKGEDYVLILDRAEAIAQGLDMARENDLVLIAGKGHEDYQILGTRRIHFDDREIARDLLAARAPNRPRE